MHDCRKIAAACFYVRPWWPCESMGCEVFNQLVFYVSCDVCVCSARSCVRLCDILLSPLLNKPFIRYW